MLSNPVRTKKAAQLQQARKPKTQTPDIDGVEDGPSPGRMTLEDARNHIVRNTNSYERMGEILMLIGKLNPTDWLTLLGEWWSGCDNIGVYRKLLREWLGTDGPIMEMMTPTEQAAYAALPEMVTVYRGCGPTNLLGASWSLDHEVANRFPFFARYRTECPVVVTAKVRKSHILAVKLDRNEAEVITFSARARKAERATTSPAAAPAGGQLAEFGASE